MGRSTSFSIDLLVAVRVLNENLSNLGVKNEDYEFVGIIGVDEDLLAFVPRLVRETNTTDVRSFRFFNQTSDVMSHSVDVFETTSIIFIIFYSDASIPFHNIRDEIEKEEATWNVLHIKMSRREYRGEEKASSVVFRLGH